jgi:hypothetical protein
MTALNTVTITLLAGALLAAAPESAAVTSTRIMARQGGAACQLSVPTTASQVRPRATGMRNEGTTSEFVICQYDTTGVPFFWASIYVATIDGGNYTARCTAMAGIPIGDVYYSTKTADTGTTEAEYGRMTWEPGDLGGTTVFSSDYFSVTCLLPPGASIMANVGAYEVDVGA